MTTFSQNAKDQIATKEYQSKAPVDDKDVRLTVHEYLLHVCALVLKQFMQQVERPVNEERQLRQSCVMLLRQLLMSLEDATSNLEELEQLLVEVLSWSIEQSELRLQATLMEVLTLLLKPRFKNLDLAGGSSKRASSRESRRSISQISLSMDRAESEQPPTAAFQIDYALLDCIKFGLSSPRSQPMLGHWARFLESCLPLYAVNVFQVLLPLTGCITKSMELLFGEVRNSFERSSTSHLISSEPIQCLNVLFNTLEQVIAQGHDHILKEEVKSSSMKSPEQVQGFFGNMVSGVFSTEMHTTRSAAANNRLTVVLCFKDAVKVSFMIWSWGDERQSPSLFDATTLASFNYTSVRLRNRTRRALEHLFLAEALECLEALAEAWRNGVARPASIMNLLHTLEASRPKYTMPAMFNAIYSRTNPAVLDPSRKSTLTSEMSDVDMAAFLVAYTRSMDDDALDEVWTDCMTFLKDVLGNPMPHRQTLPLLLEFIAVLGVKSDNTNFGEQRRMRREIGVRIASMLKDRWLILAGPVRSPTCRNVRNKAAVIPPGKPRDNRT